MMMRGTTLNSRPALPQLSHRMGNIAHAGSDGRETAIRNQMQRQEARGITPDYAFRSGSIANAGSDGRDAMLRSRMAAMQGSAPVSQYFGSIAHAGSDGREATMRSQMQRQEMDYFQRLMQRAPITPVAKNTGPTTRKELMQLQGIPMPTAPSGQYGFLRGM